MKTITVLTVVVLITVAASVACAQVTWEGQTGVFLNPLALNLSQGKAEASVHYLSLEPAGALTTYGLTTGAARNFELGLTRAELAVGGLTSLDILHGKYVWAGNNGAPNLALGGTLRITESGGPTTTDLYVAATKIFPTKTPIIVSATIRNTNALGNGLFGKDDGRTFQFGGFLGVQATPKLIVGAEYYGQPDADDWLDLAARYVADSNTFVDVGLARINDTFDNQFALGITHIF